MSILVFLLASAVGQATPLPPPPITIGHVPPAPTQSFVVWTPGEATCDGLRVKVVQPVRPRPGLAYGTGDSPPVTLAFAIDADGRPVSIVRTQRYVTNGEDIAPALAATRFTPGAHANCSIGYAASRTALADAPVASVREFTVFPMTRPTRDAWTRSKPVGSTCFDPSPDVRNRAFPAFDKIPQRSGDTVWSLVGFDIDANGKPAKPQVVAGSGDATMDRESTRAVAASRFAPGARQGCLFPYWRRGATLAAPPSPDLATLRPAGSNCPIDGDWARKPVLTYPENYRRREIEGWAIVAFDVAPWGQTGNVRVLRAEPASDFGAAAENVIRQATKAPSPSGYTGCVERVRYVIGKPGMATPDDTPEPPAPF